MIEKCYVTEKISLKLVVRKERNANKPKKYTNRCNPNEAELNICIRVHEK